jgi:hypothetical protein
MYTLLELESKTFGQLKKIGDELNVLPKGDRRYRQSWIDAIAGVNPPLLQLLEDSPAASAVEQVQEPIIETVESSPAAESEQVQELPLESKFGRIVYPRPARGAIAQAVKTSPGVEVDRVQEPIIETVESSPAAPKFQVGDLVKSKTMLWGLERKSMTGTVLELLPRGGVRVQFGDRISGYGGSFDFSKSGREDLIPVQEPIKPIDDFVNTSQRQEPIKPIDDFVNTSQRQEAIVSVAENTPGVEVDRVCGAIVPMAENFPDNDAPKCPECFDDGFTEDEFGCVKVCQCNEPKLSYQKTQSAIVPASKNLPGSRSKTTPHQLLELFKSSAHIIEDSPGVKTEETVSESAIAPAVKNRIEEGSDRNPILTGIPLSDRFVTRYTPPQSEVIHFQSDADGQLSLLDFEVESVDEPPDPDNVESLDAFREAIARWDSEHSTSSSDHPTSSVRCEPNSVHCEPLEVSLDSFCEWAPCPDEWYEPADLLELEQSKVSELSLTCKSSITSDFSIPTFGRLGDRSDRSDEPPDTGIFARLPKPKPPNFPPQIASWTQVGRKLDTSWTQVGRVSRTCPETIPKLFHRVAAGTSTQPARSPPGGDAV